VFVIGQELLALVFLFRPAEKNKLVKNVLLAAYPFSDKFAWVADKYGVSWQLNLERN